MLQALTRLSSYPLPQVPIGSYHYSASNGSQYEQWMQEGGAGDLN